MDEEKKFSFEDDIRGVGSEKSELAKVSEILMNKQYGRRKTNLEARVIATITTLDTIAWAWDIAFLKSWIPNHCEYRTSIDGQGRKDIVGIAQAGLERQRENFDKIIDVMGKR